MDKLAVMIVDVGVVLLFEHDDAGNGIRTLISVISHTVDGSVDKT